MNKSKIAWTNVTWNPTLGCSRVSAGCDNCYAERISHKAGWTKLEWTGDNANENIQLKSHKLIEPYKLKEPSMVFVNSMSDLWHPKIPTSFIDNVFTVMNENPQHIFQILTKRPRRAASYSKDGWAGNIYQGVSVEDRRAIFRIDQLRECASKMLFISFEPLLEPLGELDLEGIGWVIVGGESGFTRRKMDHAWAREIRDQCVAQDIPFFFKQSSAFSPGQGTKLIEADGTTSEWQQYPKPPYVEQQPKQLNLF